MGIVQLSAYSTRSGLPVLRWSQYQVAAEGPRTFLALSLDTPDLLSPCGDIHPRTKADVGRRLAEGAYAVAHARAAAFVSGPQPVRVAKTGEWTLTIDFAYGNASSAGSAALEWRRVRAPAVLSQDHNFELLVARASARLPLGALLDPLWRLPTELRIEGMSVVLSYTDPVPDGAVLRGVRYAWVDVPEGHLLFLSEPGYPAAPFQAMCDAAHRCELVEGGRALRGRKTKKEAYKERHGHAI